MSYDVHIVQLIIHQFQLKFCSRITGATVLIWLHIFTCFYYQNFTGCGATVAACVALGSASTTATRYHHSNHGGVDVLPRLHSHGSRVTRHLVGSQGQFLRLFLGQICKVLCRMVSGLWFVASSINCLLFAEFSSRVTDLKWEHWWR